MIDDSLWVKRIPGYQGGPKLKVNAFKTICQHYSAQAFELLKEIVENKENHEGIRFQGLKFILEQAWGKASQYVEVKVAENISPDMMTSEQLKLAAAGQTQELVCNLIASGKLEEYTKDYKEMVLRKEMDVTHSCKEGDMDVDKAQEKAMEDKTKDREVSKENDAHG